MGAFESIWLRDELRVSRLRGYLKDAPENFELVVSMDASGRARLLVCDSSTGCGNATVRWWARVPVIAAEEE